MMEEEEAESSLLRGIRGQYYVGRMAASAGHHDVDMMHRLEAVALIPRKQWPARYEAMHEISTILINHDLWPLRERSIPTLKDKFLDDTEESIFLRAMAALLLGFHYKSCEKYADAVTYFKSTLELCSAATENERQKKVRISDSGFCCEAGEIVDTMASVAKKLKEAYEHFLAAVSNRGLSDTQPGVAMEMMEVLRKFADESRPLFTTPPTLNSCIMAQVKALPQVEKTFLIFRDGPIVNPNDVSLHFSNPAINSDYSDLLRIRDEHSAEARAKMNAEFEPYRNCENYEALEVNLKRLHAGKTNKLFGCVQFVVCDRTSSHQKNLLSTFVLACQEPYQDSRSDESTKQRHPPQRPCKVLFPSPAEANDPHIKTFMALMGCSDVGVADPVVLELLKHGGHIEAKMKKCFSKRNPHLRDKVHGIKCGNCMKVGPTLQKCDCGTAYYCNNECLKAQWPAHQAEHKIAKKKAKKKRQQKKCQGRPAKVD